MVLECNTPLGARWYHYAHCQEITAEAKTVERGQVIGKLGKSGTSWAHLHFAVFKIDPKGLRSGIDTVAKTTTELNAWWEDPFITLNMNNGNKDELPKWFENLLLERNLSLDREGEFRSFWEKAIKYDDEIAELQSQIISANNALSDRAKEVSTLVEDKQRLKDMLEEREELITRIRVEKSEAVEENTILKQDIKVLEAKVDVLEEEISRHRENNDLHAYTFWQRFFSLFKRR
jgi:hypothetical protein